MAGYEDYRYIRLCLCEFPLQIEPAQPRKPDVQDKTTWCVRPSVFKELLSGIERFHVDPD